MLLKLKIPGCVCVWEEGGGGRGTQTKKPTEFCGGGIYIFWNHTLYRDKKYQSMNLKVNSRSSSESSNNCDSPSSEPLSESESGCTADWSALNTEQGFPCTVQYSLLTTLAANITLSWAPLWINLVQFAPK